MTIQILVYSLAAVINLIAGIKMLIESICDKTLRRFIFPGILFIIAGICWSILVIITL